MNQAKATKIIESSSEMILQEIRKKLSRLILENKCRLHIQVDNHPKNIHRVQYYFRPSAEIEIQIFKTETLKRRWFRSDRLEISYCLKVYEIDGSRYILLVKSSDFEECRLWFDEIERAFQSNREVEKALSLLKEAEKLNKKINMVKAL
jgi:hypothetical protein